MSQIPAAVILNTLSPEDIAQRLRETARNLAPCQLCGKEILMRPDQRFCSGRCRTKHSQLVTKLLAEQREAEIIALREEVGKLKQELARLTAGERA